VACLAGVVSILLLLRQHDAGREAACERPRWGLIVGAACDPGARPFLWYLLAWNSAVGLSASFFSYHMLGNLAMGFVIASLHGVAVAAVRIVSAPLWGRAVDRCGARPVLIVSSFGIAAVPAIWLFPTPTFLWPLVLEAVLAGALWGGHGIAAMDLTIRLSPRQARPFYVAVFAAAGGVGFAAASVLAGLVAATLPDRFELLGKTWANLHVLFFLSAVARAVAGFAALPIQERGALGVPEFLRAIVSRAAAGLGPRLRSARGASR
jgi:MFS family permease